jgi:UrcA family protein
MTTMRTVMMTLALTTAAAPLAGGCAERAPALKVSFAGIDPSTPSGRAEAVKRINRAAVSLCRDIPEEGDRLTAQVAFQDCVKQTASAALAALPPPATVAEAAR